MHLSELAARFGGVLQGDCTFDRISTDTRSIAEGELFVALDGPNFKGSDFISDALQKGAVGVVSERVLEGNSPYWQVEDSYRALGQIAKHHREQFHGKVVGITGSAGKTTVKGMLANICRQAGNTLSTQGNLNNHIGVPLTLMKLSREHQYAVIEAGANAVGEIAYLGSLIEPDVALVTNVMPAHIGGFGSLEAIEQEKSEIYRSLKKLDWAVINLDAKTREQYIALCADKLKVGFSVKPSGNFQNNSLDRLVTAENSFADKYGRYQFTLCEGEQSTEVRLQVLGKHNIHNALAASSCAFALGIGLEQIKQGLETYSGVDGRMQLIDMEQYLLINDCYNANPGAMKAAIDYLAPFEHSILVCGDMAELGDDAAQMHKDVGEYAKAQGITSLLAVGQHANDYIDGFGEHGVAFEHKSMLVDVLLSQIAEGSTVLIKGSRSAGMEDVVSSLRERRC
ncbi:UDP-N-acetylmuramoyl-tripeptide--D-alanyl-D-alanine ligase [Teredinibacter sp. KSP-S5-2]|uniref:UDP-N-acetylmuramoyl-tripeptide--D-alanyl-D- alanine ligase n=1 Tax=Teredinibacter sp. KSP-S5-2 TaxID=3034506 RepID=UPI00293531FD|nr:UDP-N-acetylmuramoyl-tripeptide--D-alanyl-D-alanine ligase [Teredinibacter sp. KSP-S5-2]WNO09614.1 UDP-N-acetylmuramoyl-tripeptide--D-alanyl-D-alanine ligase [Teredinibacter sp. KSP-S5-2]